MAKLAAIKGEHLYTVKVAQGVALHLTSVSDDDGNDGVRVTPVIFGKIQNAQAYEIPQSVVDALVTLNTPESK